MSTFADGLYQWGGAPVGGNSPMEAYAALRDQIYFVDGDSGSDGNSGKKPSEATKTIQKAIDLVSGAGAVIYVFPLANDALDTDPDSYAETLIIGNDTPQLSLIGVPTGRTQGGLPQLKIGGDSTTAMIDVRAPGCTIRNMGINGASSTGGGIKLTDDGGTTYVSFGTTIENCHFKNCKCHATNGTLGGAIYSTGSPWQVRIANNTFYKNVAGIVIKDTSYSVPQDWVIENNTFDSSVKTDIDVDIYVAADGCKGLVIRNNDFATVDVPTIASGSVVRYIYLNAGTSGAVVGNRFACLVNPAASEVTFGAAGTAAVIPTTVRMAGNIGESSSTTEQDIVYRT